MQLLHKAARNDQLRAFPAHFRHLKYGLDGLLLRRLDKSARIHEYRVRSGRIIRKLMTRGPQPAHQIFRINLVLGAAKRNDTDLQS